MYTIQDITDHEIELENGALVKPLITMADGYGGRAQIAKDDGCYVLYLLKDGAYRRTAWWFKEAAMALVGIVDTRYKRVQRFAKWLLA
jgi:hypothetical protein